MSLEFRIKIPFVEALGLELLRFEGGEAELALTPRADQLNSLKVVHGGVSMTMLDVAMAHAARSPRDGVALPARGVVTVEMKTSFMRPGVGRLRAHGKVLTQTQTLSFCEASLFDAADKLIAHATGTFKLLRAAPAGSAATEPNDGSD
ncbi:MAG: PaaI family thioesterase [Burkholderiaceae bacterium]